MSCLHPDWWGYERYPHNIDRCVAGSSTEQG